MSTLKSNYLVKKRNVLNDIRSNNMTLQELRFFSIYLSKINAQDISTRVVRFLLSDFRVIMELESRIKIDYIKKVTDGLLCKVINIPDDHGGYTGFQLFKECKVSTDGIGEWYVEIDAHDKALPLMFEFKERYFSYRLWNALRLKSFNQLRMYEILKQYEKVGKRILPVKELRELLGIEPNEYPRFNNFKKWVLDACQQALAESTDIKFSYESYGKRGPGGKILTLKFHVEKNDNYVDQLTLDMFIEENRLADTTVKDKAMIDDDINDVLGTNENNSFEILSETFKGEFTLAQVEMLYRIALPYIQHAHQESNRHDVLLEMYDYFMLKYAQLNAYQKPIRNRFGLLKTFIDADVKKDITERALPSASHG